MQFAPSPPALVALLLTVLGPFLVSGQEDTFELTEGVTAVDVLIEPGKAGLEDLEVLVSGEPVAVVGLEPARGPEESREPWSVILYFDTPLSDAYATRWAARTLGSRVAELIALGPVEIRIADPHPHLYLPPTRDVGRLSDVLTALELDPPAGGELFHLRSVFLSEAEPEGDRDPWIREERALVGRRLNTLLAFLVDRGEQTPRRVVWYVSSGFDTQPELFYRGVESPAEGGEEDVSTMEPAPSDAEDDPYPALAETLAAYGWSFFPLLAPEQGDGLVPGLRIGKWRVEWNRQRSYLFRATREERRDPERAAAWIELGRTHLVSERFEAAEKAYRKALYHFAGDPKTSKFQAEAAAGLSRALTGQEERESARHAAARAVALDPSLASRFPEAGAGLLAPSEALRALAAPSMGELVDSGEALSSAVASLARRRRLTLQLEDPPIGRVAPLQVVHRRTGETLPSPSWVRLGPTPALARARAQLLLAGEELDGPLEIDAELVFSPEPGLRLRILSTEPRCAERLEAERLRVTTGRGLLGDSRPPIASMSASYEEVLTVPLPELAPEDWLAIVVDQLAGACWGATLLEVEAFLP